MNPATAGHVLRVEGLIKIYGKRTVVDGVSFHVDEGEIVGLLGPNGAGKTTSFRMACGLIPTNGGIVYLSNQDVTHWPMYKRSRDGGMGYLPQDKSVFQRLTVENNLYGVMEMLGMKHADRKTRCEELLEKFRLTHLRHNYGGGLSGGERRRLEIARSLVSKPKIILLDEPFAAIDPVTVSSIQEIIRQLAHEGISILITDHSVQDTLEITQRSYVIESGKVLCHGTPTEVLANPEARKVYFGDKLNSTGQPVLDVFRDIPVRSHHTHKPKAAHTELRAANTELPTPKPATYSEESIPVQTFHVKLGGIKGVEQEIESVPPSNENKDTKRLKRNFQTITMPHYSRDNAAEQNGEAKSKPTIEPEDSSLSTIINNLGQVIGFRK
ncbi:ABC transporter ATP-binding protein [Planctomycetales bacterium]|nr:ABC transporter ATP-binding protein [Planctomycetales bacterium]